ncbi:hypothetical protein [Escherichia coli]|uniref:hypothetical protein n=1 Tax=Escherichia coli TaxID=562 RepID=UPI00201FAB24|nr:hypothetical protein [Escherichia coli]MCL7073644.1 hypothetical protein [Escherichia coli]MCL7247401.1 hypothetical protein [Escherichia coli]HCJ5507369.1 hypothetical protein [Escherichia coli]HCJ9685481.1 hypothetical protein [Escherichia coli]HCJ9735120.1 hypothetical protein [Escherichia coli]
MKAKLELNEKERADLHTVLEDAEYRLKNLHDEIDKEEGIGAILCDIASNLSLLGSLLMDREGY